MNASWSQIYRTGSSQLYYPTMASSEENHRLRAACRTAATTLEKDLQGESQQAKSQIL